MAKPSLGEAVLDLSGDDTKLQQDVDQAKSKVATSLSKIGGAMKSAGQKATLGLTVPLLGMGYASLTAASDLQESMNAVKVVFGEASEVVLAFSDQAAESAGLAASEFNQMAAVTGAMLINMGLSEEEAANQAINLTQRAADMASIFNTDVSQALSAIQAGLRGEADPLEKFGVRLAASAVSAKALAMGLIDITQNSTQLKDAQIKLTKAQDDLNQLVQYGADQSSVKFVEAQIKVEKALEKVEKAMEGNVGEITNSAKAQASLALLFEQTNSMQGDFVNTSDDLANSSRIAKAALLNEAAALGQELLPFALQAVTCIRELIDKFKNLDPEMKKNVLVVGGLVAAIGPLLIVLGTVISAVGAIVGVVGGPLLAIILAAAAVVALLSLAWKNDWMGMQTTLKKLWTDTLEPIFIEIKTWLQENIPAAIETLKHFWVTVLKPAIEVVWAFINDHLLPLFRTLGEFLGTVFALTLTVLAGIWQNVLQPALENIEEFISTKLQPIFETLADFWENTLKPALENINFLDTLAEHFSRIGEAIQVVIGFIKTLTEKLKKIDLPDWMTPGSPTPWEIGLIGVSDAMRDVANMQINLGAGLQGIPTPASAIAGAGGGGVGGSITHENHFHIGTLIADERGLTELERRLRPIRDVEDQRTGTE